ncbi:hypothetical protein BLNAU_9678 [Blattamonas nauphoetae]|uniref:Uncharacterized protein n=1 Tax=Blattamonas nauphoetae TaxID=2049346 RepID=A0ABQ9XUY9_9EUKA|nr:hypothetical protein BLNAU_9678 [Blattamonas nauphoetae]
MITPIVVSIGTMILPSSTVYTNVVPNSFYTLLPSPSAQPKTVRAEPDNPRLPDMPSFGSIATQPTVSTKHYETSQTPPNTIHSCFTTPNQNSATSTPSTPHTQDSSTPPSSRRTSSPSQSPHNPSPPSTARAEHGLQHRHPPVSRPALWCPLCPLPLPRNLRKHTWDGDRTVLTFCAVMGLPLPFVSVKKDRVEEKKKGFFEIGALPAKISTQRAPKKTLWKTKDVPFAFTQPSSGFGFPEAEQMEGEERSE